MRNKLPLTLLLVAFFAYSTWVIAAQGYFGFLTLAWREPWGTQMFLDLIIALGLVTTQLVPDARRRGMNPWPFVLGTVALGSIAPLAYLLVRRPLR
ncbi:MAG: hypothetical protein IPK74_09235 [Deltaproteobacteria bacterium]|nr:hypothetical protein [Deltaproteobacteria bacterium]